tara:strand:+ start:493 stop:834 length:342 start_codon:yes stop_codon:yes gene_type:complete
MHKAIKDLPVQPQGVLQLEMLQVLANANPEWMSAQEPMFLSQWLSKAEQLIESASDQAAERFEKNNPPPLSMEAHRELHQLRRQTRDLTMAEYSETPSLVSSLISDPPSQAIN